MRTWILKLRLIFLPFLMIGVSSICLYTLMNWLIFIKFELFSVREVFRNFGLPLFLPMIPLLIGLHPRIKLLAFKNEKKDRPFIYLVFAALAIALPTIIAQEYLTKATGKLTELEGINSINTLPKTKYYSVENFHVSKKDVGVHVTSEVTGSKNDSLRLSLYLALPIYESLAEVKKLNPPAWLGFKYTDRMKIDLSPEEKERKFEAFLDRSQKDFDSKDVQYFLYLDRIGSSDDLNGFQMALKESSKTSLGNPLVLVPVLTPFNARTGDDFAWIFLSYAIGCLIWLVMISFHKINEGAVGEFLRNGPKMSENVLKGFITEFMIPTKNFFVTPLLIDFNIFIFLVLFSQGHGFISFKAIDLIPWGANYGPSVATGEYWRLLSSTFLHGGILHLAGNMFGLVLIGPLLEPILGKAKFAFTYLATGVIASLASLYWYDASVSVGASGAIFGLCGVFLALLATNAFHNYFDMEVSASLMSMIGAFVCCNLMMGLTGQVDNAAHLGGLVSGFILGLFQSLYFTLKSTQTRKYT